MEDAWCARCARLVTPIAASAASARVLGGLGCLGTAACIFFLMGVGVVSPRDLGPMASWVPLIVPVVVGAAIIRSRRRRRVCPVCGAGNLARPR